MGAGVSFPDQLTLQSLEIMNTCVRICSNLPPEDLDALPEHLRSKSVSLWDTYQENRDRTDNYCDVAASVMAAAAANPPVAWLTPGHPLVFDSVSQKLLRDGRAQGWNVEVVPAISCFDTILAEVGYDPANGLFVYEAYSLVMAGVPLSPWVANLLLQPSAFGTDLAHYQSEWMPDLAPLRDYLLQFFGPHQPCAFVRSRTMRGGPTNIFWCSLDQMTTVTFQSIAGSTLFIPPAEEYAPNSTDTHDVQPETPR